MNFVAKFERHSDVLFRFDTRIYLDDADIENDPGQCVGAIVAKNPGSAMPKVLNRLAPLVLDGDNMLPSVGNRFLQAFTSARKPIPPGAYIRVWNLFYVCNKNLSEALRTAAILPLHTCASENDQVPIVWYGWGGDNRLNPFKRRFFSSREGHHFFFDHRLNCITPRAPSLFDFAKHTQGMPMQPVVEHLATLL